MATPTRQPGLLAGNQLNRYFPHQSYERSDAVKLIIRGERGFLSKTRVAVVTGAARGLGRAVVANLSSQGVMVVCVDLDATALETACANLPRGKFSLVVADLSSTQECTRVIEEAVSAWGHVDILVNCAAVINRVELESLDDDAFAKIVNTNMRAVLWLCRGFIPEMESRGWGRVVNVTSVGIHTGGYSTTSAVYEMTKGAVHNLTKTLARSTAGTGVLVNSVAPGGMATHMLLVDTPAEVLEKINRDIPLGRLAQPEEVAELVCFLASERNTYSTGTSFDVNGGVR